MVILQDGMVSQLLTSIALFITASEREKNHHKYFRKLINYFQESCLLSMFKKGSTVANAI